MPFTKYTKVTKFKQVIFTKVFTLQVKTRREKNYLKMLDFVLFTIFRGLFPFPNLK